ncbi:MAG: acyl carrier protein [Bacteroidia bacterium]|nr:acyl carrier protein [Bacteroidia bacterium]
MNVEEFIHKIEEEYEDLQPGKMKPDSEFRKLLDWNSINALIMISLIDTEYDVQINADDIQKSITVNDLFEKVKKRTG